MACDCMRRIEEKLTALMVEEYHGWKVEKNVEFENKSLIFDDRGVSLYLTNPVMGKVSKGKSVRKFTTQIRPTYCPFCGKKYNEENDNC